MLQVCGLRASYIVWCATRLRIEVRNATWSLPASGHRLYWSLATSQFRVCSCCLTICHKNIVNTSLLLWSSFLATYFVDTQNTTMATLTLTMGGTGSDLGGGSCTVRQVLVALLQDWGCHSTSYWEIGLTVADESPLQIVSLSWREPSGPFHMRREKPYLTAWWLGWFCRGIPAAERSCRVSWGFRCDWAWSSFSPGKKEVLLLLPSHQNGSQ